MPNAVAYYCNCCGIHLSKSAQYIGFRAFDIFRCCEVIYVDVLSKTFFQLDSMTALCDFYPFTYMTFPSLHPIGLARIVRVFRLKVMKDSDFFRKLQVIQPAADISEMIPFFRILSNESIESDGSKLVFFFGSPADTKSEH